VAERPYARKVVLHCPRGHRMRLDALVEAWIHDGVQYVGVAGLDAAFIEDLIDEIHVLHQIEHGTGNEEGSLLLTASHEGESLAEALHFATQFFQDYGPTVQLVTL